MEQYEYIENEQDKKLDFLEAVCSRACAIGKSMLERGETLDVRTAFNHALVEILSEEGHTKNDLTSLWAMLLLGSREVKRVCEETNSYYIGPQSQPGTEGYSEQT
jgi:hypothetical protein